MSQKKTLTFVLNDPPYENARTTTAFRLIDIALRRGFDVNVFAYEGAVSLPFAKQAPHANAVHGRDAAAEGHPTTKDWVGALVAEALAGGQKSPRRSRGPAGAAPPIYGSSPRERRTPS